METALDERDLIHLAVRGEKAAFAVFHRAASEAASSEVRSMLDGLAREELAHLLSLVRRFIGHYPALLTEIDVSTPMPAASDIARLTSATSAREVLALALQDERRSVQRYSLLRPAARSDAARRVLRYIVRREQQHVRNLERMLGERNPVTGNAART